jgi:hypothetical protein
MQNAGFDAEVVSYFHGCATGIIARKPVAVGMARVENPPPG